MKASQKMTSTTFIILSVILKILPVNAIASEKTDSDYDKYLTTYKVNPKNQQSYCFTDGDGKIQGQNIDLQIRLASVSKLLTSLWAVEEKGINYRYETKLFIQGNNLHIKGSFDPFMSTEKMFFLVSELNRLGHTHFSKITYDKKIQINPNAQMHTDVYPLITRESNAKNLKTYFNTESWSKLFKAEYDRLRSLAKTDRFVSEVNMKVDSVEFSENNPFGDISESNDKVKVLTMTSPEMHKYLKETNVKSNNYSSQTIFQDLGGAYKFEAFLADRFSLTNNQIKLYNGSGLPTNQNGTRYDNYATCAIMLDLISSLKDSAERQGKEIEDIVAVPGSDAGTFRNRLNSSDLKNSFVAKTGTLMHTSSLAGAMSTKSGFNFFGVFNQTSDIKGAKAVQNEMVRSIMTDLGGPKVFNYRVEGFHAYDNNQTVKNFELNEDSEFSDFSSIEGNLK